MRGIVDFGGGNVVLMMTCRVITRYLSFFVDIQSVNRSVNQISKMVNIWVARWLGHVIISVRSFHLHGREREQEISPPLAE